jgi:hypothetical protein
MARIFIIAVGYPHSDIVGSLFPKWKEFKDSWTKELVDTQPNIEVATPVVEVADKIISLLTETLDISKDYAENTELT